MDRRHIRLEGSLNLRDLGGYASGDGRRIRAGCVFRSDELHALTDAPARPLLFHCAAGKDRTGIAAAVVLGVLGVPDDVILDDYELTSTYFTPRKLDSLATVLAEHGIPDERIRPLLEARRPVLAWNDRERASLHRPRHAGARPARKPPLAEMR